MEANSLKNTNRSCVVIVNQRSGTCFSQIKLESKVALQSFRDLDPTYSFPENRQAAIEEAYSTTKSGAPVIMVWGGDGSINAVLQGIMRARSEGFSSPKLILLGGGSGSDFIRTLKLKDHQVPRTIDVGRIDFIDKDEPRYFINGFSFGVTAEIAALKGDMPRWLPGPLKYLAATFIRLTRGHLFSTAIIEGREHPSIISAMALNGQFVGGGMRILNDSSVDDGCFECVILPQMEILSILNVLKSVYLNGVRHHRQVSIASKSDALEIRLPKPTCCETDGETFEASHLKISILRQTILVQCCL